MTRRKLALLSLLLASVLLAAYPLDGYDETGIRRLEVYRLIHDGKLPGRIRLPAGALLPTSAIRLRLAGVNDAFDITADTPRDPELQAGLERIVGNRHPSYRAAVVDITDPLRPRYAAVRSTEGYTPGSIGKLLVMTGLFNELRKIFPHDVEARARVLRKTWVVADTWVVPNSHEVPVVNEDMTGVVHRSVRVGDRFTLLEWVDHMISPSSNAAGSMVWKQALLLNQFGRDYPPSAEAADAFLTQTPRQTLSERSIRILEDPLVALGLDTTQLHLRKYFTQSASRAVPGRSSHSTPQELLRWLVKLEQGKVVDGWSSLEMKKMMYVTRRRIRYAASPALTDAAVYFKSGSLYQCRPEPEYQCGKYRGNANNVLHSVAIIESPATGPTQRVYLVAVMSNTLKINSAVEHLEIGTQLERFLQRGPGQS